MTLIYVFLALAVFWAAIYALFAGTDDDDSNTPTGVA